MPINPDYTYENSRQELEPYMLYGDRSTAGRSFKRKDSIAQDLEYLQGMYPGYIKRLQEYVVLACDHLDYKNSPMYDEYPDRMMINQICDSICDQIREDGALMDGMTEWPEYEEPTEAEQEQAQMEWEAEELAETALQSQERGSSWEPWGPRGPGRPRGPWGPCGSWGCGPGGPWGPGPGGPWRPGPGGPWRPGPGRPRRPGPGRPRKPGPWGSRGPWSQSMGNGLLDGVVTVLLLNEMHRRRCRNGHCR